MDKKAVLYLRVSTETQAEAGTSLESQRELCEAKAKQLGVEVYNVYEDAGISGSKYLTRPALQEALRAIEEGSAQLFIAAKLDRFSRDSLHQKEILRRIERAGGKLVLCDLELRETEDGEIAPESELQFGIVGNFAEYERKVIRQRTMKGRRKRAELGQQPIRALPPFGYHIVTAGDVLTGRYPHTQLGTYQIVEDQARVVREIFQRYADGESLRKIALHLHESGVPTAKGGAAWMPSAVRAILRNPVHKGEAFYGKTKALRDEALKDKGMKNGLKILPNDQSRWIKIDAPAIVDVELWEACAVRMSEARARCGGSPKQKMLLTGLLRCPTCGNKLWGKHYERPSKVNPDVTLVRTYHYSCNLASPSRRTDKRVCNSTCYNGHKMEAFVLKSISEVSTRPELITAAIDAFNAEQTPFSHEAHLNQLRANLEALDKKEKAIIDLQVQASLAGVDTAAYMSSLKEIADKRGQVKRQLEATQAEAKTASPIPSTTYDAMRRLLENVKEALDSSDLTTAEKRDLLAEVIDYAIPQRDSLTIYLRNYDRAESSSVHHIKILCTVEKVEVRVHENKP